MIPQIFSELPSKDQDSSFISGDDHGSGSLESSQEPLESPQESLESPQEPLESPQESDESPKESDESLQESLESPQESDESPQESLESPQESLESPQESLESPQESLESPQESDESPQESLESPQESLESPQESLESPEGSLESPEGSLESPEGSLSSSEGSLPRSPDPLLTPELLQTTKPVPSPQSLQRREAVPAPEPLLTPGTVLTLGILQQSPGSPPSPETPLALELTLTPELQPPQSSDPPPPLDLSLSLEHLPLMEAPIASEPLLSPEIPPTPEQLVPLEQELEPERLLSPEMPPIPEPFPCPDLPLAPERPPSPEPPPTPERPPSPEPPPTPERPQTPELPPAPKPPQRLISPIESSKFLKELKAMLERHLTTWGNGSYSRHPHFPSPAGRSRPTNGQPVDTVASWAEMAGLPYQEENALHFNEVDGAHREVRREDESVLRNTVRRNLLPTFRASTPPVDISEDLLLWDELPIYNEPPRIIVGQVSGDRVITQTVDIGDVHCGPSFSPSVWNGSSLPLQDGASRFPATPLDIFKWRYFYYGFLNKGLLQFNPQISIGPCVTCNAEALVCTGWCKQYVCAVCSIPHRCKNTPEKAFCTTHAIVESVGLCTTHNLTHVCRACLIPPIGSHSNCFIIRHTHCQTENFHMKLISITLFMISQAMECRGVKTPFRQPVSDLTAIFSTERPPQYSCVPIAYWKEVFDFVNATLFLYFQGHFETIQDRVLVITNTWLQITGCMPKTPSAVTFATQSPNCPDPTKCSIAKFGFSGQVLLGIDGRLFLRINNKNNDPIDTKYCLVNVQIDNGIAGAESKVASTMRRYDDNILMISFCFTEFRNHRITISMNGITIPTCSTELFVRAAHPFASGRVGQVQGLPLPTTANFSRPNGICVRSSGDFYITDTGAGDIKVLNEKFELKKVISKRGTGQGELEGPTGIAIDNQGNLVVCDTGNKRLQVFSPSGEMLRCSPTQTWTPYTVIAARHSFYVVGAEQGRVLIVSLDLTKSSDMVKASPTAGHRAVHPGVCDDILYVGEMGTIRSTSFTKPSSMQFCALAGLSSLAKADISDFIIDSNGVFIIAEKSEKSVTAHTPSGRQVGQGRLDGQPLGVCAVPKSPYQYLVSVNKDGQGYLKLCSLSQH